MAQYISKSDLVAEIKRISCENPMDNSWYVDTEELLNFLNTLEVKEVNLDEELVDYHNENFDPCDDGTLLSNETGSELAWYDYERIAKHFFELGLRYNSSYVNMPNIDDTLKEMGIDPDSKSAKSFKEFYYMALENFKAQKGEKV